MWKHHTNGAHIRCEHHQQPLVGGCHGTTLLLTATAVTCMSNGMPIAQHNTMMQARSCEGAASTPEYHWAQGNSMHRPLIATAAPVAVHAACHSQTQKGARWVAITPGAMADARHNTCTQKYNVVSQASSAPQHSHPCQQHA